MILRLTVLTLSLSLVACQSGRSPAYSGPIIDPQGVDLARYEADLGECEAIAEQVPVAERTVVGAATGAAIGGVFGAVLGNSRTAARGAGVGAVGGGVKGASSGLNERDTVVHKCLRGRGYRLLN